MELFLVQILVVVANTQARTLRTEVEKGFMRTAFDHELVDPKTKSNFVKNDIFFFYIIFVKGNNIKNIKKAISLMSKGNQF